MNNATKYQPLSIAALRLLRDIGRGQNRVFHTHAQPFGWRDLERLGFAKRESGSRIAYAQITDAGRACLRIEGAE